MDIYWVRKARLHKEPNVSCGIQLQVIALADHERAMHEAYERGLAEGRASMSVIGRTA